MTKTIKQLNIHFYVSIIVLAVLFLLVLLKKTGLESVQAPISVVLERYVIIITLIAIPAALKLFAHLIKKTPKGCDTLTAIRSYRKAWFLRLYIIHVVALGNMLLYALSGNSNFMWFTVVLFVVYLFCKPSLPELENMTEVEKTKNNG